MKTLSRVVRTPRASILHSMGCTSSAEAKPNEPHSSSARLPRNPVTKPPDLMGTLRHPRPGAREGAGFNPENAAGAEHISPPIATARSSSRVSAVTLHGVCGYTRNGVPAYSNGTSNTWTSTKNFREGIFMGYQWQCVEFVRRWLWVTHRLLLPERKCAYCFASCTYAYRLKKDPSPLSQRARAAMQGAATEVKHLGPCENKDAWEKVPAKFVKQGSRVPPVADSLIVYPMSWGSPWGHIGVITAVDLDRNCVYVADQNRYFHHWNGKFCSAVFQLDCDKGRFYVRDHESECLGWLAFPAAVEGHDVWGAGDRAPLKA